MAPDDDSKRAPEAGGPAAHRPFDPVGRATHLVLGSAAVVLGAVGRGLLRLGTESDPPGDGASTGAAAASHGSTPQARSEPAQSNPGEPNESRGSDDDATASWPGMPNTAEMALAVIGVGAEVTRRLVGVAAAAATAAERGAAVVMQHQPVPEAVDRFREEVTSLGERGGAALRTSGTAAMDYGLNVAAQVVPGVVTRVDLDGIVEQVDIGQIIDRLDLNEIVGRLDLNAIAERIDIERILGRLDLAAITQGVLDQLDLTAISQRVLDQLDLTAVAMRVIDELELGELIRESSSTVTVEAVDALRVGGMNADRFVAQLMNRILLRRNGEAHSPDGPEAADASSREPRP